MVAADVGVVRVVEGVAVDKPGQLEVYEEATESVLYLSFLLVVSFGVIFVLAQAVQNEYVLQSCEEMITSLNEEPFQYGCVTFPAFVNVTARNTHTH